MKPSLGDGSERENRSQAQVLGNLSLKTLAATLGQSATLCVADLRKGGIPHHKGTGTIAYPL
jgi:hypothetical protein